MSIQTVASSNKETYIPIQSGEKLKKYREHGCQGLYISATRLGLQPIFPVEKMSHVL